MDNNRGKIEGEMDRGRQRETILDGIMSTRKILTVDVLNSVRNNGLWRDMISNACRQGP
jgi:hypothetical protein